MLLRCFGVIGACVLLLGLVHAQALTEIDFKKANQLRQKVRSGQQLTADEQTYLDRAKQAFKKKGKNAEPAKAPTELRPLTDMTAAERYKGEDGGLYGAGRNEPPEAHRQMAMRQAKLMQPLDAQGKPAHDGKIGFVSVGMSNTTQVFSTFVPLANSDPAKAANVIVVDGAQGGLEAQDWAQAETSTRPGQRNPWDVLAARLKSAGVTP